MTSSVCHRFVQNAWKKERCSNCFKSKEEHVSLKRETPVNKRPLISSTKSRGIIKNTIGTPARRKRTVSFKPELTEIIGFGGEDWSEVEEDDTFEEGSSESSEDDPSDLSEDDKDLDKITKSNTEQNANITATTTSDRRRTFTQLMLGHPQKDSDGKKQTLLVSVTPFGQDESERAPPKRASKTVSHIPIAKNKEILVEARPKVVLTSYLKNRESPEPTKTDKNDKKDNDTLPIIKEKLSDKENKKIDIQEKVIPNNLTTKMVKHESKLTVHSDKLLIKDDKSVVTTTKTNVDNTGDISDDISDRIYDDVADEDETTEIVETLNESSVLKKVEVVSVSQKETSPVLETPSNEQIVKSELKVQLCTAPLKNLENNTSTQNLPLNNSNNQGQDSSSEESADSLGPSESREQAGEPDGRADPDVSCEPPALPRSPPPIITPPPRSSFLHGAGSNSKGIIADNKPKVPSKPEKVTQMVRKPSIELTPLPISQADQNRLSNKRRAPNPPPTTSEDTLEITENIEPDQNTEPQIQKTPLNIETIPLENRIYSNINTCPEEETTLSTPDIIPSSNLTPINTPIPIQNTTPATLSSIGLGPEPAPRKNISMSSDNLLYVEKSEEKRKDKIKTRFSLMKFLRVGGNSSKSSDKSKLEDVKEKIMPFPKPRLVIVHPLDLNGTIEVVAPAAMNDDSKEGLPPAPPPRNLPQKSEDLVKPPPKSDDIIRKHRQLPLTPQKTNLASNINNPTDSVYANLGEIRSGLVPSKPQRTASMREREALIEQQIRRKNENANLNSQEHVYERVAPPRRHSDESNNNVNENKGLNLNLKSSGYAGSESDLEIYSPCGSFYGVECEISDRSCTRPCQLRSRKGRSIVHKNLEDNYGAVVVANHEALAQVLEHLHLTPTIPSTLRNLQSTSILHWSDFSIVDASPSIIVGRRSFYHALWGAHHVTLSVSKDQILHKHPVGLAAFNLNPVTEFNDLIDGKYFPGDNGEGNKDLIQASVTVFPWMQIDTIQSLGTSLKSKNSQQPNVEQLNRDASFILLQFVNSLKSLQAQGIEEVPLSLSNFILCHDVDKDTHHRLCLLQGFSEEASRIEELGSLCQSTQVALDELFTNTKLATLIKTLLKKESAMSLSQVKSILEFSLWGPSDVAQGVPIKDRELALQRWLDLERATVLHGLVGTRVQLSVLEEYHLLFLVRSSAKMMCEASMLLETNGVS